jgi:transposase
MDQYEAIRTAHRVYGQNISEIARSTGHSRNTIKKALRGEACSYKERRYQFYPALEPYLDIIRKWLESDKESPSKQRHTARRIYNRLMEEEGYTGCEASVRRYVRQIKMEIGIGAPKAFIPGDPLMGREAEVDWGSCHAVINEEKLLLKFLCIRSKYSGKHFVRCYPCERQQAFFDGHIRAFAFFGGIFPVLIYDNLTTAVQKVLRGKGRIEQEAFLKFRAYHSFEARFCNPAAGHEKGGVEGMVGFVRRNYMVPIPEAESLTDLNERLHKACHEYGRHRISGREKTVMELFQEETGSLLPLPDVPFSNLTTHEGRVDKYATVMLDKNHYSVPTRYVGFRVRTLMQIERVEVHYGGKRLAVHDRLYGNNKWSLDPDHYLDLLAMRPTAFHSARPIRNWRKKWPEAFNRLLERFSKAHGETDGIKEFISVLKLGREYPISDVEAAVELAVNSNIGSGEGVRHILIYMKEKPSRPLSLDNWETLPPPDLSVYAQLGGVE